MAKILVTGTAGFIGMHTALKLSKEGHEVVGVDNLNEYYDVNLKYGRLAAHGILKDEIVYNKKVTSASHSISFVQLGLEDKEALKTIFDEAGFDYVIHLAAQAGVRYSLENPDAYVESNVTGFLNIIENCRNYKIKHLVFASSSSVYGLNVVVPFQETHPTEHPVSLYAATKKANEMMAHAYAHLFDIPMTGLRFFTVYGPWGRPDMALFKFTKNILEGKPIDVYNHGKMERDFTHVEDIVDGIVKAMGNIPAKGNVIGDSNLKTNQSTAPYAIYNIGNSKPVNLTDFIHALEVALDKKADINFMPMQAGDVERTYADTSALRNAVGYTPKRQIKEGIQSFVDWYLEFYS